MSPHPFLSDPWIAAAREIHDKFKDRVEAPSQPLRMNVTVIDAPFSDTLVLGHVDTTTGSIVPDMGHIDNPDVSVTVPYAIARQLLVEQQYDTIMISFMSGEIEVEGDITMLLSLQDLEASVEEQALAEDIAGRLREITE